MSSIFPSLRSVAPFGYGIFIALRSSARYEVTMRSWRDFFLLLSALWIFSAIQSSAHVRRVQVKITPSQHAILKAPAPSHSAPALEHSAPPVTYLPPNSTAQVGSGNSFAQIDLAGILPPAKNHQLIRTGLSPPSRTV